MAVVVCPPRTMPYHGRRQKRITALGSVAVCQCAYLRESITAADRFLASERLGYNGQIK